MITKDQISYMEDDIKEMYKHLHQIPELGFEEYETSAFIQKELAKYGIQSEIKVMTGVVATIKGAKPGKTVAIRADIDCLPFTEMTGLPYASPKEGHMHACGHDAHATMLLGAARYFAEHREELCGNVRLIFQPAEEGASNENLQKAVAAGGSERGGAASMIAAGALDGVDICFALHISPALETGKIGISIGRATASSDEIHVQVVGKGGHGSAPDGAIDPMQAAAEIILSYNSLPARELSALESCVVTVGSLDVNSSWNIIPERVELHGGVRAFNQETREYVVRRLREVAEGICSAHRCTCEFVRKQGYNPTINDAGAAQVMLDVAGAVLGEGAGQVLPPMMGSEDVGYYFEVVPGAVAWMGSKPEGSSEPLHNPRFVMNLDALAVGVLLHVNNVIHYLGQ